jgi:hypothetical protein
MYLTFNLIKKCKKVIFGKKCYLDHFCTDPSLWYKRGRTSSNLYSRVHSLTRGYTPSLEATLPHSRLHSLTRGYTPSYTSDSLVFQCSFYYITYRYDIKVCYNIYSDIHTLNFVFVKKLKIQFCLVWFKY